MAFHRAIFLSASRFLPRAGITLSLLAVAAILAFPYAATAQSVESFYKGRTVTLIIPTSPGGINNLSARLVSRREGPARQGGGNAQRHHRALQHHDDEEVSVIRIP